MKKVLIALLIAFAAFVVYKRTVAQKGTPVMGYKGMVTGVENGNTLVLNTGLKVWMLGVEPNNERAEMWIKNNLLNQNVELVSDSKNEQDFKVVGATVKAYVIIEHNGAKLCANRLLVNDVRDCSTLAYMSDSSFVAGGGAAVDITDKALYMKMRTMVVCTDNGALGTAFFINKQGVAVTNNHVLNDTVNAQVFLYAQDAEDSKVYSSRRRNIRNILWTNKELDITIFSVELEKDEDAPYFNLIRQHEPVGNACHILGNPQGLMASYAKGVISAYRDDDIIPGRKLVQYDVATNGGNSGGPVINDKGEIIAVHAMGVADQANGKSAQGLNFGIDILQVRSVLDSPSVGIDYGGK